MRILIIDDDKIDRMAVRRMIQLAGISAELAEASASQEAMVLLAQAEFDCVFLDYRLMPEDGLTVLRSIKVVAPNVPVIMMTGHGDELIAVEAMKAGAVDYFPKNKLTADLMERMLRYTCDAKISQRKLHQAEERIRHLAYYDSITGIPNRVMFQDYLDEAIAQQKIDHGQLALIYFDLDRFKLINDTLGHKIGDVVLQEVAKRLQGSLAGRFIARMGGDEFVILLDSLSDVERAQEFAQQILEIFAQPFFVDEYEVYVTASIGIVLYPDNGEDVNSLLRNADTAMYRAKESGKNTYQLYAPIMGADMVNAIALEKDLRRAIEKNELVLHYQPKVSLVTGKIVGMEALVRWQSATQGLVPPNCFIPIAEETGLIVPLGMWVLEAACRQNKYWQDMGFPPLPIAVNFSAQQIFQRGIVENIRSILRQTGLLPSYLDMEITESIAVINDKYVLGVLRELRDMGINISLDDFGTGYSSLSYVVRFPVNTIKIDRSFIQEMGPANSQLSLVVAAMVAMAQKLNLKVVAEGVETEQQLAYLKGLACDEFQGFLFSRPLDKDAFTQLLQTEHLRSVDAGFTGNTL